MAAASQGGHFINKGALHSFEMDTAGDNLSLSSVRCVLVSVCTCVHTGRRVSQVGPAVSGCAS